MCTDTSVNGALTFETTGLEYDDDCIALTKYL
jgi:hypothetical protein